MNLFELHLISDTLIGLAHYSISVTLFYLVWKHEELPFKGFCLLFGAFIFVCGTTHFMSVWTLWHPDYWLLGLMKVFTAVISGYTAIKLIPTISQALNLQNPAQLEAINHQLQTEIAERKQTEIKLRESEERLKFTFSATNQGFFDLNLKTDEGIVSPEYALMLGYDPDTFHETASTWQARLHPDDREHTSRAYRAYEAGKSPEYKVEFRMRTQQGDWKWILSMGKFVAWDKEGKPTRLLGTHFDIHKRKQVEIALQNLIAGTAATTGEDFFPALANHIAVALNVSYAIVSKLVDEELHSLAFWAQDGLQPSVAYHPAHTPCERTLQEGKFHCEDSVQQQFPNDPDLVEMGAESYFGIALRDVHGKPIGDLCILDKEPIKNPQWAEQILLVFAARAAAELERQRTLTSLEQLNKALETKVAQRTQALQESETRLKLMTDSIPGCIAYFDVSQQYQFVNRTYEEWFNRQKADILGHTVQEVLGNRTYHHAQPHIEKALSGEMVAYENEMFDQEGDGIRYVSVVMVPDLDAQERVQGCYALITDISDRKQIEAALHLSEARSKAAFEQANVGLVESDIRTGKFIRVNTYFSQIMGYTAAELYQISAAEMTHPEDLEKSKRLTQQLYSNQIRDFTLEKRYIRKDGTFFWAETSVSLIQSALGKPRSFLAVIHDISARKEAERKLQNLIAGTAATTGQDFFPALVRYISEALNISYVFMAAKTGDNEMTSLAFWADGSLQPNCSYDLTAMPCAYILQKGKLYREHSIQKMFPEDELFVELGVESFLGVAVYNTQGQAIGTLCIFDSRPISEPQWAEQILQVFAARAGAELERQWAKIDREQLNQSLEIKVAERTAALKESQKRYASLAMAAPVGIFRHDTLGRCIYVNHRCCQISGLTPEAAMGDGWQEVLHPDDRNRVESAWLKFVQENSSFQLEYRFQHSDGTVKWVYTQCVAERDSDGQMLGSVGTITDISERKQAEIALQNLILGTASTTGQDFFPALVRHIAEALEVNYVIVAEKVGNTCQTLAFWGNGTLKPSQTYDLAHTPCQEVLQTGEFYCQHSVKERFPKATILLNMEVESYLGVALRDTQDNVMGNLCVLHNNPLLDSQRVEQILRVFAARAAAELERKKAQIALEKLNQALEAKVEERTAELQASQAYYQGIIADQTELICRFLPDGTLTFVNDAYCNFFQKSPEELLGHSITLLLPEEDREIPVRKFNSLSVDNPVVTYEHRVIALDGTIRWQQWTDRALFDPEGNFIEFQAVGRDITEGKRAEEQIRQYTAQLEASNQELEAFAYSVSHDLRAPLRAIDGFSQALLEDYGETFDEEGKDYFDRIRKNVTRMGTLIDDLLSLSRVSRSDIQYTIVNLSALAQELLDEWQESQPERQVEVVIAPEVIVSADPTLMRVVLTNLLQNAWKFTNHHSTARIEFGILHQDEQPIYFVRDDGAGFDMAYSKMLFGVFQRLHSTDEFPGTGIGLATVQRAIHRHGGKIWAESVVEQGATFYFTVPSIYLKLGA